MNLIGKSLNFIKSKRAFIVPPSTATLTATAANSTKYVSTSVPYHTLRNKATRECDQRRNKLSTALRSFNSNTSCFSSLATERSSNYSSRSNASLALLNNRHLITRRQNNINCNIDKCFHNFSTVDSSTSAISCFGRRKLLTLTPTENVISNYRYNILNRYNAGMNIYNGIDIIHNNKVNYHSLSSSHSNSNWGCGVKYLPSCCYNDTRLLETANDDQSLKLLMRCKSSKSKKSTPSSKADSSEDGDSDVDDSLDEDDFDAPSNFKVMSIHSPSLRIDAVLSKALGLSRHRLEEVFFGPGILLNGEKVLKKGVKMDDGDYIDAVMEKVDERLKVKRVKLLKTGSEKTGTDKFVLRVRVWKAPFLIDNPGQWKPES